MRKPLFVDAPWSKPKSFAVGAGVGVASMLSLWVLDHCNRAQLYGMSEWLFAPLLIGVVIVLPWFALMGWYRRLMKPSLALVYALGYGINSYATMTLLQLAEYGPWKGVRGVQRAPANFLMRELLIFGVVLTVAVVALMGFWGLCRLIRGPVVLWREGFCSHCGYDLTGNVSGTCSECGTSVSSRSSGPRLIRES